LLAAGSASPAANPQAGTSGARLKIERQLRAQSRDRCDHLEGRDLNEQREQFILVNHTRPLPDGLFHELLPVTDTLLPPHLLKHRFLALLLVAFGAEPPASFELGRLRCWLRIWKVRLCRLVRHAGNLKYAWSLSKRVRLPCGLPYPKQVDP
jgi:hypothetical protein